MNTPNIFSQIEQINLALENLQKGKSVMDYILDPKHQKLSNERSSLNTIIEMQHLQKGTKLYFVSVRFSSTSTGNHESFDVYYIQDGELIKVWLPSVMTKQRGYSTSKYLWSCHGGNYSFTQSIADSISYQVFNESGWFQDLRL